jgi:hypothetical protein
MKRSNKNEKIGITTGFLGHMFDPSIWVKIITSTQMVQISKVTPKIWGQICETSGAYPEEKSIQFF